MKCNIPRNRFLGIELFKGPDENEYNKVKITSDWNLLRIGEVSNGSVINVKEYTISEGEYDYTELYNAIYSCIKQYTRIINCSSIFTAPDCKELETKYNIDITNEITTENIFIARKKIILLQGDNDISQILPFTVPFPTYSSHATGFNKLTNIINENTFKLIWLNENFFNDTKYNLVFDHLYKINNTSDNIVAFPYEINSNEILIVYNTNNFFTSDEINYTNEINAQYFNFNYIQQPMMLSSFSISSFRYFKDTFTVPVNCHVYLKPIIENTGEVEYTSTDIPTNLSLIDGVIDGDILTSGTSSFTVVATDADNTMSFTVTITSTNDPWFNYKSSIYISKDESVTITPEASPTAGENEVIMYQGHTNIDTLQYDYLTGNISGSVSTVGTYSMEARCLNVFTNESVDTDYGNFMMNVNFDIIVEESLELVYSASQYIYNVNDSVSITPVSNGTAYEIISGSLPDGLTLDPVTGIISGVPTVANQFNVSIKSSNNVSEKIDNISFNIVNDFTVTYQTNVLACINSYITLKPIIDISFNNLSFRLLTAPDSLTIDSEGIITGDINTSSFIITVEYGNVDKTETADISVTVSEIPFIDYITPIRINPNEEKLITPSVYNSTEYSIVQGDVPSGMILDNRTGEITCNVPEDIYNINLRYVNVLTDGVEDYGCVVLSTELSVISEPPTFVNSEYTYVAGQEINIVPESGNTVQLMSPLPDGLLFDPETGIISGKPTQPGEYNITLLINSLYTETIRIVVEENTLSSFEYYKNQLQVPKNCSIYLIPKVSSDNPDDIIYSFVTSLGLSIDPETGIITGTVNESGILEVKAQTGNQSVNYSIDITVLDESFYSYTNPTWALVNTSINVKPVQPTAALDGGILIFQGDMNDSNLTFNNLTGAITGTVDSTVVTKTFNMRCINIYTDEEFDYGNFIVSTSIDISTYTPAYEHTNITGSMYVDLTITPVNNDYKFTLISESLPAGLSFDSATGVISGKPSVSGTHYIAIQMSKDTLSFDQVIKITISGNPITALSYSHNNLTLPTGVTNIMLTPTITAGNTDDITYSITGNVLSIDPVTGIISGDISTSGTYNIVATASNSTNSKTFTITVNVKDNNFYEYPTVTTSNYNDINIIPVTDSTAGFTSGTITLTPVNFPTGLSVNTSGVISGSVSESNSIYDMTVQIDISSNNSSWQVNKNAILNTYIPVYSVTSYTVTANKSITITPENATGYTFKILDGPLSINQETGEITGSIPSSGNYTIVVEVTTDYGVVYTQDISVTVTPNEISVSYYSNNFTLPTAVTNFTIKPTLTVEVNDVTFSSTNLPTDITLDTDGIISAGSLSTGTYNFTVTASNSTDVVTIDMSINVVSNDFYVYPELLTSNYSNISISPVTDSSAGFTTGTLNITGGNLPGTLTVDSTGKITGSVTESNSIYNMNLTINNVYGVDQGSWNISRTANLSTYIPVYESSYSYIANESITVTPENVSGYTFRILEGTLNIDTNTGVITGNISSSGNYTVVVEVTTSEGIVYTQDIIFNITPNTISGFNYYNNGSVTVPTGATGLVLNPSITVEVNDVTFSSSDLPQGFVLKSDGKITAVSLSTGVYTFTVTASNSTNIQNVTMNINVVSGDYYVYSDTLTQDTVINIIPNTEVTVDGVISVLGSNLPDGLTVNDSGVISGDVSESNSIYNMNISIISELGEEEGSWNLSRTAKLTTYIPAYETTSYTYKSNELISITPDYNDNYTFNIISGNPNVVIMELSGMITGSIATTGIYIITVEVTTENGITFTQDITISIDTNPITEFNYYNNGILSVPVNAKSFVLEPILSVAVNDVTFSSSDLPQGFILDSDGKITAGSFDSVTEYNFTVTANNATNSISVTLKISVVTDDYYVYSDTLTSNTAITIVPAISDTIIGTPSVSSDNLPSGLSIDNTGKITGNISSGNNVYDMNILVNVNYNDIGSWNISRTAKLSTYIPAYETTSYETIANKPLTITPVNNTGYTFALSEQISGVTISDSGVITCVVPIAGNYVIVVEVSVNGVVFEQEISLNVIANTISNFGYYNNNTFVIPSTANITLIPSISVVYPDVTFTSTDIPSDFTLDTSGSITGSNLETGEYIFTVTASNSTNIQTATLTINVMSNNYYVYQNLLTSNNIILITPETDTSITYTEGEITFNITGNPSGVSLNDSRAIEGTITTISNDIYNVNIIINSDFDEFGSWTLNRSCELVTYIPAYTELNYNVIANQYIEIIPTNATGYTFTKISGVLDVNQSTGIITGSIPSSGTYVMVVEVSVNDVVFEQEVTVNVSANIISDFRYISNELTIPVGVTNFNLDPVYSVIGHDINFKSSNLPSVFTLDSNTGDIQMGIINDPNVYTFEVTAYNSTDSKSWLITINIVSNDFYVYPEVLTSDYSNISITPVTDSTAGFSTGTLTITTSNLPSGLSVTDGVINGSITEATRKYNINVIINVLYSLNDVNMGSWNIVRPVKLSTYIPAYTTTSYTFTANESITITPARSGYTFTKISGVLDVDQSTGVISGSIQSSGTYDIVIEVSANEVVFEQTITVDIVVNTIAVEYFNDLILPVGTTSFTLLPIVSMNVNDITYTADVPEGFSFNEDTGVISVNNFYDVGEYNFTVTASNSTDSKEILININIVSNDFYMYPDTTTSDYNNISITPVTDSSVNFSEGVLLITSENNPNTLSINKTTGVITGVLENVNREYNIDITINSVYSKNDETYGSWNISRTENLTIFKPAYTETSYTFVANESITITPVNVPGYTYKLLDGPLSIDTNTGVITGSIPSSGTYIVVIEVTDGNITFTQDIEITIGGNYITSFSYYKSEMKIPVGVNFISLHPLITVAVDDVSYTSENLPDILELNEGVIRLKDGKILNENTVYTFTVTASNTTNEMSYEITLNVSNDNYYKYTSFDTSSYSNINITPDTVEGFDGTIISIMSTNLPNNLQIDDNGVITGSVPNTFATYNINVSIDGIYGENAGSFTVARTAIMSTWIAAYSQTEYICDVQENISIVPSYNTGYEFTKLSGVLDVNSLTGAITGSINTPGTYDIVIKLARDGKTYHQIITVTIRENHIESFNYYSDTIIIHVPVNNFTLVPTVSVAIDDVTYSSENMPDFLTLNTETGYITGSNITTSGSYRILVLASNTTNSIATEFTIDLSENQFYIYTPPSYVTAGTEISIAPTNTETDGTVVVTGHLPEGLSLGQTGNVDGVIVGTVTTGGVYTITLNVEVTYNPAAVFNSDNSNYTVTRTIELVVEETITEIYEQSEYLGEINTPINITPEINGPATYSYSGTLPSGVSFDPSTGSISGTATEGGIYTVTVTADNNATSEPYSKVITITINNPIISFTYIKNTFTVPVTSEIILTPSLEIAMDDVEYRISDHLSVDEDGIVRGSFDTTGVYDITVTAYNTTDSMDYVITFNVVPNTFINYDDPVYVTPDTEITISPVYPARIWDGSSIEFSFVNSYGLTINDQGIITGSLSAGSYSLTIVGRNNYTDNDYFEVSEPLLIVVEDPADAVYEDNLYTIPIDSPITINPSETGTYELTSGSLPEGMELQPDGTITGTPTSYGTYTFTVTNTETGKSDTLTIRISDNTFNYALATITIPSSGFREIILLPNISASVYECTLGSGSLPEGMELQPDGTIRTTGATLPIGEYHIVINCVLESNTLTSAMTINVVSTDMFVYPSSSNFTIKSDININPETVPQSYVNTFSATGLTPDLTIDPVTGVISGSTTIKQLITPQVICESVYTNLNASNTIVFIEDISIKITGIKYKAYVLNNRFVYIPESQL